MPKPGPGGGDRHGGGGDQRQRPGRDVRRQEPDRARPQHEDAKRQGDKLGRDADRQREPPPREQPPREQPPERERQGQRHEQRQGGAGHRENPAADDGPAGPPARSFEVGATANQPELVETLPIATAPGGARRVVLSLGPDTKSDTPLPDLAAGDRLLAFAELELTTDADDPNHPGLIGNAYPYAPNVTATLLLARGPDDLEGGVELSRAPWHQAVTHQRHHAVVTFGDAEARVPAGWKGPAHVNLVVDASHPDAKPGDVILVGQNEKTPTVVQDMAGIRVVRFRPGDAREPSPEREVACLCASVPIAKRETVVLAHELAGLQQGEQLLVRGTLVTDADGLAAPARISTRMFLAESPQQTEPGGVAASDVTWKGHLSKYTGFNCVPGEGAQTSHKYGVATVRQAPGSSLYVNLVAVSAAPFGGAGPADQLAIDTSASSLAVTRFPAAV